MFIDTFQQVRENFSKYTRTNIAKIFKLKLEQTDPLCRYNNHILSQVIHFIQSQTKDSITNEHSIIRRKKGKNLKSTAKSFEIVQQ